MHIPVDKRSVGGMVAILLLTLALCVFFGATVLVLAIGVCLLAVHGCFFRDPMPRTASHGQASVVAPAQGKVVEISRVLEDDYLHEPAIRIGIFLSVFDVHVTRSSWGGTVKYLRYVPGEFFNALLERSARENESNWIGLEDGARKVLIRQITGAIARRIFWDVEIGSQVQRSEKIGMICYGSRVECYVPERNFRIHVKLGDKVKAGQTVLGEWL